MRPTPSRTLDRTADYLVAELRRLGFQPGFRRWNQQTQKNDSAWVLRYPIPGQRYLDRAESRLMFSATSTVRGKPVVTEHGSDALSRQVMVNLTDLAYFSPNWGRPSSLRLSGTTSGDQENNQVLLVVGPHTPASVAAAEVGGRLVVYVPPAGADTAAQRAVLTEFFVRARGVMTLRIADSATFAAERNAVRDRPVPVVDGYVAAAAAGDGAYHGDVPGKGFRHGRRARHHDHGPGHSSGRWNWGRRRFIEAGGE